MNKLNKELGISRKWVDGDLYHLEFPEYSNASGNLMDWLKKQANENPFLNPLGTAQSIKKKNDEIAALKAAQANQATLISQAADEASQKTAASTQTKVGLSTGWKIGIAAAGVIVLSGITYLIVRAVKK